MTLTKETLRLIKINQEQIQKYISNNIKTAKYNVFTFLPLAILFQFTNYFNIFFLVTAVLLSIPIFSPIEPATAMGPFIFVLLISLIRELVEDLKKANYDKLYNNSEALQYNLSSSHFEKNFWKDISVGNILKIQKNDMIPADVLILKSSAENGFGYLQTSSLDGETGLKPREAIVKFQNFIKSESDLSKLKGEILVDLPNENIYSINGNISIENNEKIYFSVVNTLLRGGMLKNVDFVYGLVIYTGKETKIMKNIKNSSIKLSSIERKLNSIIIYVIVITLAICILCTILGYNFWVNNKPEDIDPKADYLFYSNKPSQAINEIFKIFGSFFTIFNTLIPISVMITMEVVKGMQVFVMDKDTKMREKFGEKSKILNMRLHEDLGNIKYIFTDKTGTLTKNEMEFKSCSIFTRLYDDKPEIQLNDDNEESDQDKEGKELGFAACMKKSIYASSFDPNILIQSLKSSEPILLNDDGNTPFQSIREAATEFFLNIAINHNVLTETDNETGEKYYSGSSPDETVLVQSAKEIGIEFIERSGDLSKVKILDKEFTFEILHRFEYSSERKRSSIIVKDEFGYIKLYMKGADKVIIDKTNTYSKDYIFKPTKDHLDLFCKGGLRTLVYSMKMITEQDFKIWEKEYKDIQEIVLKDKTRKNELESKIEEIETQMILMGATALEDKLQDEVKGVLNDFIEADINVWMLTGDQLDTAESIGYSCKLFNDDTEVFKLREGWKNEQVLEILRRFLEQMEKTEENILNYKIENKRKLRNNPLNKKKKNIILNAQTLMKQEIENFKGNINYNQKYNKNQEFLNVLSAKKTDENENLQMLPINSHANNEPQKFNNRMAISKSNNEYHKVMTYNYESNFDKENKYYDDGNGLNPQKNEKVLLNMPNSTRFENYRSEFNQLRENLEKGNHNNLNSQKLNNLRKIKTNSESSNNYNYNNITNSSYARGFGNNGPVLTRKGSQIPIDINQLNAGDIKFIGGNLDKKSNKITLNFVKNSQNSIHQSNRPMTPGYSKSNRPISSSIYSYRKNNTNAFGANSNNNVVFKNNLNNLKENYNQQNENGHTLDNEDSQNYEPNDMSILKYMVDIDFFEHNKNNQNFSIIKNLIGENVQASKMNKEGIIEFKPAGEIITPFPDNGKIENLGDLKPNNFENLGGNYKKVNDGDEEKIDDSNILNLDELLENFKLKVINIDKRKTINPFDFVIKSEKNDFSLTNFGIIIEGNAIMQCLNPEIYPVFWELILKTRAVICCRCSPNFKSNVVEFVKKMSNSLTLAIGDGGNDVNMIKAANIGIGIFGKEGHQAAFNSDYAISQFKYLERLLFFHGRYSILRNSYFINIFFFKNLIFTFPQFWFSLFSGFSGALLWDDWYYLGYNSYISTFPAACKMLFDEDIDITFANYKDKKILEFLVPDIYKQTRDSKPFNIPKFFFVFFCGFVHSLAIYFIPYFHYRFNISDNIGRSITLWDHSIAGYFTVLAIQYIIVFEDTFLINIYVMMINLLQFGITIFFILLYNSFDGTQVGGILFDIITNVQIWLLILLTTYACVLPYIIIRRWEVLFSVDIINNLRHRKYQQDYKKKTYIKKIEEMSKFTRSLAKFRKILNQNKDSEPENLADKKIKAVVDGFLSSKKKSKILHINDNQTNQKRNIRKLSNYEEREANVINIENNNNFNQFNNPQRINSKTSLSIKNEHSKLKAFTDSNNMNINIINNNIINSNNQGNLIAPNTYSIGRTTNMKYNNQNNSNVNKNKSNTNTNHQNSSSNNFNYNYIHPYDEEDLINEHLGGKFKPITTTTRRVLNHNDSYENINEYNIISRDNNKFEFNFNKFNNVNNKPKTDNENELLGYQEENLTESHLIKKCPLENHGDSGKIMVNHEKKNINEIENIFYDVPVIDDFPAEENKRNGNENQQNNFNPKPFNKLLEINDNEFTFKKTSQIDNGMKSSIINNEEIYESNKNETNSPNLNVNKRDPLVHEYPLEITHSLADDYIDNNDFEKNPLNKDENN